MTKERKLVWLAFVASLALLVTYVFASETVSRDAIEGWPWAKDIWKVYLGHSIVKGIGAGGFVGTGFMLPFME